MAVASLSPWDKWGADRTASVLVRPSTSPVGG
jgi:hypothetical protein